MGCGVGLGARKRRVSAAVGQRLDSWGNMGSGKKEREKQLRPGEQRRQRRIREGVGAGKTRRAGSEGHGDDKRGELKRY